MNITDAETLLEYIDNQVECSAFAPNDWETDFLDDISKWCDRGDELSKKQSDCLEKLYRKAWGDL